MPLIDLQRRMRELGRIRTGQLVTYTKDGKTRTRPEKLETFRLTSPSKTLIEAAASVYGGTVEAWNDQWELVCTAESLDILIPPGQALSQWYELWSGGGCQRRCDGRTNVITDEPCACPADPAERRELAAAGKACKPTTRLNVILPDIPDLGVWRLECHGYYAAVELAGTAEFLEQATAQGARVPARLRLDQREVRRPGQGTRRWAVPVIELHETRITDLLAGVVPALPAPGVNRRERVARPGLGSGPPDLPEDATFTPEPAAPQAQEAAEKAAQLLTATPEPVEAPGPSEAPTAPETMTEAELRDAIRAAFIPTAVVRRVRDVLYPEQDHLDGHQRAVLWAELQADIADKEAAPA